VTYPLRQAPTEYPVTVEEDLAGLRIHVHRLVGLPIVRADRHYGDEVCLELGEKRPYDSQLLAGELQGTWQITTQASDWTLQDAEGAVRCTSEDPMRIEPAFEPASGSSITDALVTYPHLGLLIKFSNGWSFVVAGSQADGDDLHNWVMFDDGGGIILAGPGQKWFFGRAD